MTAFLLLFALIFSSLAVLLAIVASLMRTCFYDRPVNGLAWRAPIAAATITGFLGLWSFLESKSPGRFDSLFRFSPSEDRELEQFWSEKKTDGGATQTLFDRRIVPSGRVEYADANGRYWRRSDNGVVTAIIIEEDGERRRFEAELGPNGTFVCDRRDPNSVEEVRYIETDGKHRVMTEGMIGTLTNTRYGALLANTLFNLAFLLVWIVTTGLSFEFQWSHAFLMGAIGWVTTLLFVWPAIQSSVANLAAR
jgi:hypothetical protein